MLKLYDLSYHRLSVLFKLEAYTIFLQWLLEFHSSNQPQS
jgi:hypothetical protein